MRWLAIGASLIAANAHAQSCPCYSSLSSTNPSDCGVADVAGTNPTNDEWNTIIDSVSLGPANAAWTGPAIAQIDSSCGGDPIDPVFPCELIEAILMQESSWQQFCAPTAPASRVGESSRTIVSEDCGYGASQVTTDMHEGETAPWDRTMVAGDARYNVETGLYILADKWTAVACVGANAPSVVEDWYLATWAYNGYAYVNNPNNPNYDAMRTVCDPNSGCSARPYQELVWGWMEHPPSDGRYAAIEPAYPKLSDLPTTSATPTTLPEPSCGSPTSCATTRATHVSRCLGGDEGGSDAAQPPTADLSTTDGGTIEPPSTKRGGCGCDVGGRTRVPWLALLVIALAWRRRWH